MRSCFCYMEDTCYKTGYHCKHVYMRPGHPLEWKHYFQRDKSCSITFRCEKH